MPATFGDLRPRPGRLDLALFVLLGALCVLLGDLNLSDGPTRPLAEGGPVDYSAWIVPAFGLLALPLLWRSSAPVVALGVFAGVLVLHAAAFGEAVRCGVGFPVAGLLAFSLGARVTGRPLVAGAVLALACTLTVGLFDALGADVLVVGLPVAGAAFVAGLVATSRTRMAARLRQQTIELQHARDERVRLEVATDRADLSGELDALLQRRLRSLATLAEEGEHTTGAPQTSAAMLAEIERESRATLDEMRKLVGALRGSDGAVATSPMPTLTSLEALVVRMRGPRSRVQVQGDPRVLPPGVELSAYRIVEHLMAALEEAPGVDVTVRFEADRLELEVHGQAKRRAEFSGGLARARARVELHQGTLSSTTQGGQAATTATLPMLQGA